MNRQVVVRELPKDSLGPEHFEMREAAMPEPGEGEALVRTILMSIDAANRAWMQGATYREAVKAGDVMHTYSIGEVVSSNDPALAPGRSARTCHRLAAATAGHRWLPVRF